MRLYVTAAGVHKRILRRAAGRQGGARRRGARGANALSVGAARIERLAHRRCLAHRSEAGLLPWRGGEASWLVAQAWWGQSVDGAPPPPPPRRVLHPVLIGHAASFTPSFTPVRAGRGGQGGSHVSVALRLRGERREGIDGAQGAASRRDVAHHHRSKRRVGPHLRRRGGGGTVKGAGWRCSEGLDASRYTETAPVSGWGQDAGRGKGGGRPVRT